MLWMPSQAHVLDYIVPPILLHPANSLLRNKAWLIRRINLLFTNERDFQKPEDPQSSVILARDVEQMLDIMGAEIGLCYSCCAC